MAMSKARRASKPSAVSPRSVAASAISAVLAFLAAPAASAQDMIRNPNVSADQRGQIEARDQLIARRSAREDERRLLYFGETDGWVAADPTLFAKMEEIQRAGGQDSVRWNEANVSMLRQHILADGRVDMMERDLLVEALQPTIRVITIYPAGRADRSAEPRVRTTTAGFATRSSVAAILDAGLTPITWDDADPAGTVRQLTQASGQSPDHARQMKDVIAAQVARHAPKSSLSNAYGPIRSMINISFGVIQTFDEDQQTGLRHILADAIEEGLINANTFPPDYLYRWVRPTPPDPGPSGTTN